MSDPTEKLPTPGVEKRSPAGPEEILHPLARLREDIERLFDDVLSNVTFPFATRMRETAPMRTMGRIFGAAAPVVDLVEKEGAYELTAELPGVDEKDVRLTLSNNRLTIRGEKKEETEETRPGYFLSERRYGAFERSFELPDDVDAEHIEASFTKGLLIIKLPKNPAAVTSEKKIEIKGG